MTTSFPLSAREREINNQLKSLQEQMNDLTLELINLHKLVTDLFIQIKGDQNK